MLEYGNSHCQNRPKSFITTQQSCVYYFYPLSKQLSKISMYEGHVREMKRISTSKGSIPMIQEFFDCNYIDFSFRTLSCKLCNTITTESLIHYI